MKLKKSSCFTGKIENLGQIIQARWLEIATNATDVIKGLKTPTDITEYRSFLGLWNVFHRILPNFIRIAAPFNQTLKKKDQPTLFGALSAVELKVMHELQDKFVSPTILLLPFAAGR